MDDNQALFLLFVSSVFSFLVIIMEACLMLEN